MTAFRIHGPSNAMDHRSSSSSTRTTTPRTSGFKLVERIGKTLPGVEVTTSWGQPSLKVGGRMFVCMASHKSAEPDTLVVMMDIVDRDALIEDDPETLLTERSLRRPSVRARATLARASRCAAGSGDRRPPLRRRESAAEAQTPPGLSHQFHGRPERLRYVRKFCRPPAPVLRSRHERHAAGHPLRAPHASAKCGPYRTSSSRRWRLASAPTPPSSASSTALAQAVAVPRRRPPRRALAALAGHQHSAGLALARAVHRRPRPRTARSNRCRSRRDGPARCSALEQPERVEALRTSSTLFALLGAKPVYGRLLEPGDDQPASISVVVLSHGFWQRAFGGDPNIVGRTISVGSIGVAGTGDSKNQFEVVGVLGPDVLLNAEIMPTVAAIQQMDIFLPMVFAADPCHAARRRKLQPHGAAEARRDDGAGEG